MTPTQKTNHQMSLMHNTLAVMMLDSVTNSARLTLADQLMTNADYLLQAVVDECRSCGQTWQQIGDGLNITRQAAQQRFG